MYINRFLETLEGVLTSYFKTHAIRFGSRKKKNNFLFKYRIAIGSINKYKKTKYQ